MTLNGKWGLVTGSTAGLGYAIAEGLAQAGCNIVLHGLEADDTLAKACQSLGHLGVQVAYVRADLAREDEALRLVEEAEALGGSLDIVVNNAVVRHFAPIDEFPVQEWERALAVNVSAAFHLVRLTLPGMRRRAWGRIINMSSVYGSRGTANRVDYVTTKSALLGFTRAVAMETLNDGITCNAVCPGSVLTPAIEKRVQQIVGDTGAARADAEREFLSGKQPTSRFVRAEDVAALIVFLCGPAGRDITGAVLPVEGGWLAS